MPNAAWVQDMPMHSNRTGCVSVSIRLDIYSDGHDCLVGTDEPHLNLAVNGHTEMEEALRRLWNRGTREASRTRYFNP